LLQNNQLNNNQPIQSIQSQGQQQLKRPLTNKNDKAEEIQPGNKNVLSDSDSLSSSDESGKLFYS
jgi:hypothetical protein